ncbi:hypothetical protein pb186bvf_016336 [Paramecium bursaria]
MNEEYGYKKESQNPNAKVVGNFVIFYKKLLGTGKFGKVYEAQHQETLQIVAAKVCPNELNLDQKGVDEITNSREIQIMKQLKSEHLMGFYDFQITRNNIYLFVEYCNGGNLTKMLSQSHNIKDIEIVEFIQQICEGFKNLTENKIIHRDLKPDNILLHNGKYKISDFGFAKFHTADMDQPQFHTLKGTPLFVPPQIFDEKKFSTKFDVWSLGAIVWEMVYGYPLHQGVKSVQELQSRYKQIKTQGGISFPKTQRSQKIQILLQQMLQYSEEKRISWQQLFNNEICKMSAQEFLGIEDQKFINNFEPIPQQPKKATRIEELQLLSIINLKFRSIKVTNNLNKLLNSFNSFITLKWKCIILQLWRFQMDTFLKQVECKLIIYEFEDCQREFLQQEYSKMLIDYLRNLLDQLRIQVETFLAFFNHKVNKPYELTAGQGIIPEDVILYGQLQRSDVKSLLEKMERDLKLNVFPKAISQSLKEILKMATEDLQ